ncbi:hypothetical protein Rsub_00897 [Raphidocelis subcapitata]|uniref:Sucrose phosphatase-like domain-containing protein n=1 Tax=Raphidocelis subcapitata TaxID=307507 RepID=A0A2V0NTM6_9CHLO|nr:hypothetical protein Rsub_00897 [Raphidocelis subcapitata]|eukprot:GBF88185.1 hypothetical protein Rsub_00897 [Raphidocelis subcapitata]
MSAPAHPPPPAPMFTLFADIDGSLVHYPDAQSLAELERTADVLLLPPSTTGRVGVISRGTLERCARLRDGGARIAIVSGARTTTLLARLPFLPAADAYVSENGGRIFYPDDSGLTAAPLREDFEWRALLAPVAGPLRQEALPPAERQGIVWDYYRALSAAGWRLDASGYSTAFRLLPTPGRGREETAAAIAARPPGLAASFNLGVADFYPAASGKEGAAAHLLARWGGAARAAAHLCDDDNDLPLAALVGRAFIPGITEASVSRAIEVDPSHFEVASGRWTDATEEMLDAAAAHFARLARGEGAAGGARGGEGGGAGEAAGRQAGRAAAAR